MDIFGLGRFLILLLLLVEYTLFMRMHIHNRSLVQSLCKIELGPWGGLTPETVIDTMRLTRDRHGVKTVQLVTPLGI